MHNFVAYSPKQNEINKIGRNWNRFLKQFKRQNGQNKQFPPILSQRKSSLQNYKNAFKNSEENKHKHKSVTQKIVDMSKERKLSTIDINQSIHNHKRYASQHLYNLTQQQKQLLASKEIKKSQAAEIPKSKSEFANSRDIIKQIKALHLDNKKKQKQIEKFKKQKTTILPFTVDKDDQKLQQFGALERADTMYSIIATPLPQSKKSFQQAIDNISPKGKNKTLSFELSKNERSLRFHCQEFDGQVPRLLLKKRKLKEGKFSCVKAKFRSVPSTKNFQSNLYKTINYDNDNQEAQQRNRAFRKRRSHAGDIRCLKIFKQNFLSCQPWQDQSLQQFQHVRADIELTIQSYRPKQNQQKQTI